MHGGSLAAMHGHFSSSFLQLHPTISHALAPFHSTFLRSFPSDPPLFLVQHSLHADSSLSHNYACSHNVLSHFTNRIGSVLPVL
mmetsp:Transcript_25173/g.49195  ORF Transcript_25173/g.49195 Transcript_25173/m.49195 type:complete len:84 (+) Transcript_25173:303-554(+)